MVSNCYIRYLKLLDRSELFNELGINYYYKVKEDNAAYESQIKLIYDELERRPI